MKLLQKEKIDGKEVYITEKYYLTKGRAVTGKKKILKITVDGREIPFKQIDEYGRFEIIV